MKRFKVTTSKEVVTEYIVLAKDSYEAEEKWRDFLSEEVFEYVVNEEEEIIEIREERDSKNIKLKNKQYENR